MDGFEDEITNLKQLNINLLTHNIELQARQEKQLQEIEELKEMHEQDMAEQRRQIRRTIKKEYAHTLKEWKRNCKKLQKQLANMTEKEDLIKSMEATLAYLHPQLIKAQNEDKQ